LSGPGRQRAIIAQVMYAAQCTERAWVEEALTAEITTIARQYGRYGYCKITELLPTWAS